MDFSNSKEWDIWDMDILTLYPYLFAKNMVEVEKDMYDECMEELVSNTIREIWVGPGEETIYFKTDNGWLSYEAIGDCCSESWFADIIGVESLLNKKVVSVEQLDMPQVDDKRTRQEHDN